MYIPEGIEASYLDGIIRYKDLQKIKNMGFEAMACSDHGNISGTYEFFKECIKVGLQPILGCLLEGQEIYTSTGIKPIEEIKIGDKFKTFKLAKSYVGKL